MKIGKSLTALAQELTRQRETAKDYLVPVQKLEAVPVENNVALAFQNGEKHTFPLQSWSASQVSAFTEIPKQYFERRRSENASLLCQNIDHAFNKLHERNTRNTRMVRVLDGKLRAFLSDSYKRIDSYDLLEAVLPTMVEKGLEVVSCEVTDLRLYVRAVSPKLQGEVQKGDVVQAGIMVTNSDVGAGALRVEPFVNRLVCLNGMVIKESRFKTIHGGAKLGDGESIEELLTDETRAAESNALFLKARDVIIGTLQEDFFKRQVDRMRASASLAIKNFDLPRVVELTSEKIGLSTTKEVSQSIVAALANGTHGAGLSQWGLINAITEVAGTDLVDFDTSVEMERAASKVLELPQDAWRHIANA